MERRLIIAVFLMMVVLFAFNYFTAPPPTTEDTGTTEESSVSPPAQREETPSPAVDTVAPSTGTAHPVLEGSQPSVIAEAGMVWGDTAAVPRTVVVENDVVRATFSTEGARLTSWQLKKFPGAEDDPWVELIPPEGGSALTLVLETRTGEIDFSEAIFDCSDGNLYLSADSPRGAITMRITGPDGVEIRQVMSFSYDTYSFGVDVQAYDAAGEVYQGPEKVALRWLPGLEFTESNVENDLQQFGALALTPDGLFKASIRDFKKKPELETRSSVEWAGINTKYFIAALIPRAQGTADVDFEGDYTSGRISMLMGLSALGELAGVAEPGPAGPDGDETISGPYHAGDVEVYLGPRDLKSMRPYGRRLEQAVYLGWRWIRPLSSLLLSAMQQIHRVIPNWGIAIIILSSLTKLIFYPLTQKSTKSMRAMQKLQPQMQEIREKHKNNSQKQQQEIMKLYREAGVNPLGGCLPLLLQSPVFIALFNVLRYTIELRKAKFFLWIDDLSSPDVLFRMPFSLPVIGQNFSLLPLLMGAGMFWQQRTGSSTGAGDPRMKMMGYLMPFMFTFMFYRFPSGLVLYWLVNTVLTIGQQYMVSRGDKSEATVTWEAPGKRKGRIAGRKGPEGPQGTSNDVPPVQSVVTGEGSRKQG